MSDTRSTRSATDPAIARILWVDTAKTLAIVLIVMYHVSGWFFALVFQGSTTPASSVWWAFSQALLTVRIPLFFLVSGMLAVRAIRRGWGELFRTRLLDLLWPFAIWTLLIAPLWSLRLYETGSPHIRPVLDALAFGSGHLWFLPALVVFLVVAKLVSRAPLVAIAVAAVLAYGLRGPIVAWADQTLYAPLAIDLSRWLIFLVWFLIGCFGVRAVQRVARHPVPVALGMAVLFVGLIVLARSGVSGPYLTPLLSLTGVSAMIGVSVLLSRPEQLRRLARYLAARTLAIYVGHALLLEVLAVGVLGVRRLFGPVDLANAVTMALFVPLVTVVVVWASTWMHDRAVAGRLRWLYRPPARWKQPPVRLQTHSG